MKKIHLLRIHLAIYGIKKVKVVMKDIYILESQVKVVVFILFTL